VVAPRVINGRVEFDIGPAAPPAGTATDNLFRQRLLRYTAPWSLVGWPVVSVPYGFVEGMPVSLAFVGRRFGEGGPSAPQGWHERRPDLADS